MIESLDGDIIDVFWKDCMSKLSQFLLALSSLRILEEEVGQNGTERLKASTKYKNGIFSLVFVFS